MFQVNSEDVKKGISWAIGALILYSANKLDTSMSANTLALNQLNLKMVEDQSRQDSTISLNSQVIEQNKQNIEENKQLLREHNRRWMQHNSHK